MCFRYRSLIEYSFGTSPAIFVNSIFERVRDDSDPVEQQNPPPLAVVPSRQNFYLGYILKFQMSHFPSRPGFSTWILSSSALS